MPDSSTTTIPRSIDWLTVIAVSILAHLLNTALHEHVGHGLTCWALRGQIIELGAFYVNCGYLDMSDAGIRIIALAGPLVSLLCGAVGFALFDRMPVQNATTKYFFWLFGAIGFLISTGYLLFSGVTGLGDFGTSRDGLIYQLSPEWMWRSGLVVLGGIGYLLTVRGMLSKLDTFIGGEGQERIRRAQRLSLVSYLTGVIMAVAIGFLNPMGVSIVLISAAAGSAGGTSALIWSVQMLNRKKQTGMPPFTLHRDWRWIIAGFTFTLIYTVVFGPSLRFSQ